LLTLNVPLQIGKCIPRSACTPRWEHLIYTYQWFSNSGAHTTSGMQRSSRWYVKMPSFYFFHNKIYPQL